MINWKRAKEIILGPKWAEAKAAAVLAEQVEALAQRIVSSKANDVMLLENHNMPHAHKLLTNKRASACLADASFTGFCSEWDRRMYDMYCWLRDHHSDVFNHTTPVVAWTDEIMATRSNHPIKFYMVDDVLVSVSEAFQKTCKKFNRSPLLIEHFLLPRQEVFADPIFYYADLLSSHKVFRDVSFEEVGASIIADPINQTRKLQNLVDAQGGPLVVQKLLASELQELIIKKSEARIDGECNKCSASRILTVPAKRKIIHAGIDHGCFGDNPASLPDQLVSQAIVKGQVRPSMEIIILTTHDSTPGLCISILMRNYPIREGMTVYDVETGQEWLADVWFEQTLKTRPEVDQILSVAMKRARVNFGNASSSRASNPRP